MKFFSMTGSISRRKEFKSWYSINFIVHLLLPLTCWLCGVRVISALHFQPNVIFYIAISFIINVLPALRIGVVSICSYLYISRYFSISFILNWLLKTLSIKCIIIIWLYLLFVLKKFETFFSSFSLCL